jgi:hypothetical protein
MTNALKVGSSNALLTGSNAIARGDLLTGEILFHGSHARVYKEKRFVVMRDKGERGETQMSLRLKK